MITITHIIRQMKQGQTAPFLCRADDNQLYVVKGDRATPKGLIREWLAGHLCKEFGLPIPEFSLAYVAPELVKYNYADLGEGIKFASKFIPNIQDITFSQIDDLDESILRDLFVFDYWIKNDDRCLTNLGGNPNLFQDPASRNVYVLDHNLSFDENFSLVNHKDLHVGRKAWSEPQLELFDQSDYERRFLKGISKLEKAIDDIPTEWLQHYDLNRINDEIVVVLKGFETADFWEDII